MVLRPQIEFLAEAINLRQRGLFHGRFVVLEHTRRVSQGGVEEQLVEVIAQVIVSNDVLLGARLGVVPQQVIGLVQRCRQARKARLHAIEQLAVAREDAHQRREIVGVPHAFDVRLRGTDCPTKGDHRPHRRVPYADRCGVVIVGRATTDNARLAAIDEANLAFLKQRELLEHARARQRLQRSAS